MLLNLLAAAPVAIWLYLLAGRAGYWRMRRHLLPGASGTPSQARVVAVIPARNEADVVARSITSLLTQELDPPLTIVLVDDGSTDQTTMAAQDAARALQYSHRLQVIQGKPLAEGWTGKLWAVSQGIAHAESFCPEYLLLTDADIEHAPGSIGRLLSLTVTQGFDLASLMVRLSTATIAEQFLMPAFVYFFLQLYPPGWVSDPAKHTAGAAGGCLLIQAGMLRQVGGIQAIAGQVIDDCALAALVKNKEGKVWLGLSDQTTSLRSYGGFAGVGRMISRSAFNQLRHSTALLILTLAGLCLTYLVPPLFLLSRRKHRRVCAAAACALMAITYTPALRLYRRPVVAVLSLPFVAMFYAGATLHSAFRYWSGTGGEWKGRIQDRRP